MNSILSRLPSRLGRLLAVSTLLLLAAGSVGCAVKDKQVIEQANQTHGELSKAVISDQQMAPYIQQVGDRIVNAAAVKYKAGLRPKKDDKDQDRSWMFSTKTMQFHFVNSKTLNAFTTGGEHMYVYTELLRQCKNEMELAAVMAHEYGHVFGRHVQSGMTKQTYAAFGVGAAGAVGSAVAGEETGGTLGKGAGVLAGLAVAGFTRTDETEADHLGFEFFVAAGYDPDHFGDFFRTLLAVEKAHGAGGGVVEKFTSDHPQTAERVANCDKWANDYKRKHPDWQSKVLTPVADDGGFARIKQRSIELAAVLPDDKSLQAQKLMAALPRSCLWPDEPKPPSAKQAEADLRQQADKEKAATPASPPAAKTGY